MYRRRAPPKPSVEYAASIIWCHYGVLHLVNRCERGDLVVQARREKGRRKSRPEQTKRLDEEEEGGEKLV